MTEQSLLFFNIYIISIYLSFFTLPASLQQDIKNNIITKQFNTENTHIHAVFVTTIYIIKYKYYFTRECKYYCKYKTCHIHSNKSYLTTSIF